LFISAGTTKSRVLPGPQFFLREDRKNAAGQSSVPRITKFQLDGIQITESEGNRWPPPKGGTLGDYGSEFYSLKKEVVSSTLPYSICNFRHPDGTSGTIQGSLIANIFNCHDTPSAFGSNGVLDTPLTVSFPPDLSSSRADLVKKGADAIALCAPPNQLAHVATALGELFQDVPQLPGIHLWESRLRIAEALTKGVASEFLNAIFGILPTVADMGDFLKATHKYDRAIDQFVRDAGRNVRRQFNFPKEMTTTETIVNHSYSPAGHFRLKTDPSSSDVFCPSWGGWLPSHVTLRERKVERKQWFSGAFSYHLPLGYDYRADVGRKQLMAKLFGAQPDMNTVWELAPWSWAVDWITNASSVIQNLQSYIDYGTVMPYGYMMETTTVTDTYSAGEIDGSDPGFYLHGGTFIGSYTPHVSPIVLRTTVKKRIQANPFGFGLTWDGLSTVQKTILAALGITRAVR